MTNLVRTLTLVALVFLASTANAASFFQSPELCKNMVAAGKAQPYTPTTKAPFKGGDGWVKKVVPTGGACLGEAHVLEDGAPSNGKTVFVKEGFVYWEQNTGAFRMNDCSNPFGSITLVGTVQPAPVQPPAIVTPPPAAVRVAAGSSNFTEIKLGEMLCVVHVMGGQYTNGQPVGMTFRKDKAGCDEYELEVRSRYVRSVNDGVVMRQVSSEGGGAIVPTPQLQQQPAPASGGNWCARSGKMYNCGTVNLAVIRANGEVACRPPAAPSEPGEQSCSGVK